MDIGAFRKEAFLNDAADLGTHFGDEVGSCAAGNSVVSVISFGLMVTTATSGAGSMPSVF